MAKRDDHEPSSKTEVVRAQPAKSSRAGERRVAPRLDKVFPVIVSGQRGTTFGVARNVSEGGMFLEAAESQPLGSRVTVTFAFPGSAAEITMEAEVRYTSTLNYKGRRTGLPASTRGMGLKFVRILEGDLFRSGDGGTRPYFDPLLLH